MFVFRIPVTTRDNVAHVANEPGRGHQLPLPGTPVHIKFGDPISSSDLEGDTETSRTQLQNAMDRLGS
ncbi:MAG: hypothetical protein KDD39_02615 [Bdellovibrionales bacterium]|nr:hypothetical protein [Bdellovibrionales bacterium]